MKNKKTSKVLSENNRLTGEPLHKVIIIDEKIIKTISLAIKAAKEYERLTKRKLGITGEIGEVLICKQLGLQLLQSPRSKGYDAIDKKMRRVQIKARRSESGKRVTTSGRISRFSDHPFDYAVLGLLDQNYDLYQVWRADYKSLQSIIKKEQNEKRGPTINSFMRATGRKPLFEK